MSSWDPRALRDLPSGPDETGDADPVAAFFARERADVRPLPADDLRWAGIVRAARGPRRRGVTGYLVGAAAAAVVIGSVWLAGQRLPAAPQVAGIPPAARTATVNDTSGAQTANAPEDTSLVATQASAPSATGAPPRLRAGAGQAVFGPLPTDFRLTSLSQASETVVFGLGAGTCGTGTVCPILVRSDDNGRSGTWRTVHEFPDHRAEAANLSTGDPGLDNWTPRLGDVRFADPRVGYVYGTEVLRTTDGGVSFTSMGVRDQPVADLETAGGRVVIVTPTDCTAQGCVAFGVEYGATSADRLAALPTTTSPDGLDILGADIAMAGTGPVLNIARSDGTVASYGVLDGGLRRLTDADACGGRDQGRYVQPANAVGVLIALCPGPGGRGVSVEMSTAPRSWTVLSRQALAGHTPATVMAVASSARPPDSVHLVVVGHGPLDAAGAHVLVSKDGRSFAAPRQAPESQSGFSWVGAAGGSKLVLLPGVADGGYWMSEDDGITWHAVRVAP